MCTWKSKIPKKQKNHFYKTLLTFKWGKINANIHWTKTNQTLREYIWDSKTLTEKKFTLTQKLHTLPKGGRNVIYRGGVICIKWENIGVGNVGIQCSLLESSNKKTGHALNSQKLLLLHEQWFTEIKCINLLNKAK